MTLHAVHEAAHTIVARVLRIRVRYVTLEDEHDDGGGGTCVVDVPDWLHRHLRASGSRRALTTRGYALHSEERRALVRSYAVQAMAGRAGEAVLAVPPSMLRGPGSDWRDAAVCGRLVGWTGQNTKAFVYSAERQASAIICEHWSEVLGIAFALASVVEGRWVRLEPTAIDRIIRKVRASLKRT